REARAGLAVARLGPGRPSALSHVGGDRTASDAAAEEQPARERAVGLEASECEHLSRRLARRLAERAEQRATTEARDHRVRRLDEAVGELALEARGARVHAPRDEVDPGLGPAGQQAVGGRLAGGPPVLAAAALERERR